MLTTKAVSPAPQGGATGTWERLLFTAFLVVLLWFFKPRTSIWPSLGVDEPPVQDQQARIA